MSYDWLSLEAKCDGYPPPTRGTLYTVNGTGVSDPYGPGFAADVGRGVDDELWLWQPISYPAAVAPMGPSVQSGREELVAQISRFPGPIALSGYSQGALVTCTVWRDDILSPAGRLHHRLTDVRAILNFGDPARCPGVATGNVYAGKPLPKPLNGHTTGGIAGPGCLTPEQTPPFLLSFANDGDIYAAAPVGDNPWTAEPQVGRYQTLIFDLVQKLSVNNVIELAIEASKIINQPLQQVLPLVQAIWGGMVFAGKGMNAPHWTYDAAPAVHYLRYHAA